MWRALGKLCFLNLLFDDNDDDNDDDYDDDDLRPLPATASQGKSPVPP